jgi:hypothetical protein
MAEDSAATETLRCINAEWLEGYSLMKIKTSITAAVSSGGDRGPSRIERLCQHASLRL